MKKHKTAQVEETELVAEQPGGIYNVTFPLFDKIDVNDETESPLHTYLKEQAPFKGYPEDAEEYAAMLDEIHQKTGTGFDRGDAIRWNFGKFLVSKDCKNILRFEPMVQAVEL